MGGYLTHPGLNLVVLSFWLDGMEIAKNGNFCDKNCLVHTISDNTCACCEAPFVCFIFQITEK